MHVALVTPWQVKGGIAAYSERLAATLEETIAVTPIPIRNPETASPGKFNRVVNHIPSDADVVHVQFEASLFGRLVISGVCAPAFFRTLAGQSLPVVTTLHEIHRKHDYQHTVADIVLRIRDTLLERCILSASDRVVVHTSEAKEILLERHGNTNFVQRLLHPAETDAQMMNKSVAKQRLNLEGSTALTFGWVEEKKRYEDVIRILPEFSNLTYLIAGEPRYETDSNILDEALTLAEEKGVRDQIKYLGYVSEDDVSTVFNAADTVILPYRRVAQSGVVNVALGHQRPVITSSLRPFEELADEFECLLTYDDGNSLARTLRSTLYDESVRKQLKGNARRYTETVTWDRFAEKTVDMYQYL